MRRHLLAIVGLALGWGSMAEAAPADLAKAFGARDSVSNVSISPDGKALAIIQPTAGRGAVLQILRLDGNGAASPILSSSGNPDRLQRCEWITSERLFCTIYMIDAVYGKYRGYSRLVTLNADGSDMKQLSAKENAMQMGVALYGGDVLDWLGDRDDGSLLMQRYVIGQSTTGTLVTSSRQGLTVERVNPRTLARTTVEPPNRLAEGYMTDGHGNVRLMTLRPTDSNQLDAGRDVYRYRRKGSSEWLPLAVATDVNGHSRGFDPLAIDPDKDVVYGIDDRPGGFKALYAIALDGSLKKTLVFGRDDAPVDGVMQIGRQQRVVGASWMSDRGHVEMFDPALAQLAGSISKALPGKPQVSIVDADSAEARLVLFAGSDVDPGRFYLFDKTTKQLSEILPVRPQLAGMTLGEMKSITFKAADGTVIPAYLTLPAGSDGKHLPMIVMPHGGPWSRDVWSFDWLPQFFVARGYAVLQPNYRGSTGYGEGFELDNGLRSWRTAIGDIDDGARAMIQQGIADPARLAIVGWSYGGYAALQAQVIDPDLYKAAVAVAPVTDFGLLREEWAGNQSEAGLNQLFGTEANAEAASPARHARQFKAPVLLFHGDRDQNVAVAETRLMRDRLRSAGKWVDYVEFDGLDHQLVDDAIRAQLLARTDAFLTANLGKAGQ